LSSRTGRVEKRRSQKSKKRKSETGDLEDEIGTVRTTKRSKSSSRETLAQSNILMEIEREENEDELKRRALIEEFNTRFLPVMQSRNTQSPLQLPYFKTSKYSVSEIIRVGGMQVYGMRNRINELVAYDLYLTSIERAMSNSVFFAGRPTLFMFIQVPENSYEALYFKSSYFSEMPFHLLSQNIQKYYDLGIAIHIPIQTDLLESMYYMMRYYIYLRVKNRILTEQSDIIAQEKMVKSIKGDVLALQRYIAFALGKSQSHLPPYFGIYLKGGQLSYMQLVYGD